MYGLNTGRSFAITTIALLLASAAQAVPPSNHDQLLGVPGGIVGLHAPGFPDPFNENCTLCHGEELKGAFAPSCFVCHGAFWDANQPQYPDSHTLLITGNRAHSDREVYCTFCHDMWGDDDKLTYWHAPGHGTPLNSGCTLCHGTNLDGANGIAFSCYWCHDRLWAGEGPPSSHAVQLGGFACTRAATRNRMPAAVRSATDRIWTTALRRPVSAAMVRAVPVCPRITRNSKVVLRCTSLATRTPTPTAANATVPISTTVLPRPASSVTVRTGWARRRITPIELGGFALHRPGYEDPLANGCSNCHGPELRGGLGPSCYVCHRREWDDHNFSGEPWLPAEANQCQPCHLSPTAGGVPWNHELPTSTFTVSNSTLASIGQPNGSSAKCLGCHEGAPDGPAIDDFGGNTGGSEFVFGSEAFGTNLKHHHPVSFAYDSALALSHGGLVDPLTAASGLPPGGTVAEDMLEEGLMQCTTCHNPHDNRFGQFLVAPVMDGGGLCATCHNVSRDDTTQHHIPGRDDPWGEVRGTTFNCTMCHGASLEGGAQRAGLRRMPQRLRFPRCSTARTPFRRPDDSLFRVFRLPWGSRHRVLGGSDGGFETNSFVLQLSRRAVGQERQHATRRDFRCRGRGR